MLTREQITHSPRPYTQTFSRTKSNKAEEDNERDSKDDRDVKLMAQLKFDLENGDMPLDQRLEDLGIDPVEYKTYVQSRTTSIGAVLNANVGTGYTEASKKSTSSRQNGNPRQEKRQRGSGKNYKTHPTT